MTEIELEHGVSAGVELLTTAQGIVPTYEEHLARLERGYDLKTWTAMEERERALVVAARRMRIAIDNLQAEAEIEESERKMKRFRK